LAGSTAPKRALRLDFAPNPERAARGVTIGTVRDRLTPIAEIVKVVPLSVPPDEQAPAGLKFSILAVTEASNSVLEAATEIEAESIIEICEAAPAPASLFPDSMDDDASPGSRAVVRVGIERLDEALRRLSDLIVTRFRLERSLAALARSGADVRELRQVVDDNARQLRDMRAAILKLRLVAANEMLEPLGLIVRGQRASAGKNVELELDAGQAELDKAVADRVLPVLVHLVRNAIDHGLEMPEERVRAGKSPQGKLRIRCTEYSGTRLVITVADDGRGIDIERLAQRAGRPLPQSPAELISLLSVPGLSARDEATSTSGRGMGIDIVRRTVVDELSGELEVATAQGSGTMFTLRIPLTLLIVDAFTFECSNRAFVVPVAMVDEIIEVAPDSIVQGPAALGNAARSRVLSRRGRAIPVVPLGDLLSLPKSAIEQRKALIVRAADSAIAFEIDRVIGQQEVVIRPMDDPLIRTRGVSGSTDLGDGKPTLVLDLMLLKKTLEPLRDAQTGVLT
jgi:two-component system chemotaxis sensor kinase CheA